MLYGWCDWDALGQSNITTGASPVPLVLLAFVVSISDDASASVASISAVFVVVPMPSASPLLSPSPLLASASVASPLSFGFDGASGDEANASVADVSAAGKKHKSGGAFGFFCFSFLHSIYGQQMEWIYSIDFEYNSH